MVTLLSLVSYNFLPAKTGGQKGIAVFTEFLSRNCRLTVVTTQDNDPALAIGYQLLNILSPAKTRYINPFLFFRLRRIIKKERATHLLLEHPYFGWLGILLKYACGIKLVVHSHNIEHQRWRALGKWWWPLLFVYERTVHRTADYNFFKTDEDRHYARSRLGIDARKCITVTYGIDWNAAPAAAEKKRCRDILLAKHGIAPQYRLFLFNGSLDYAPNTDAVRFITDAINRPLWESEFPYKIIICGKGLPPKFNGLAAYASYNIIYTGFVEDISVYFKGVDAFINPVVTGGGIKTKLVEALGYNTYSISTESGAFGVDSSLTGHMMKLVSDYDWPAFARAMQQMPDSQDIPAAFFEHFYWENIARKAAAFIAAKR